MKHLLVIPLFLLLLCGRTAAQGVCDINEDTKFSKFPLGSLGAKAFPQIYTSVVKVLEVTPGGPAGQAGLKPGDFIFGANGERLPVTGFVHDEAWKGTVSELGYAIERSESTNGILSLQVLRPGVGPVNVTATLPLATAWHPSFPAGDPRMIAYFEKICADIHAKVQATNFFPDIPDPLPPTTDANRESNKRLGDQYFHGPFFGLLLLASPNWNDTTGPKPYRSSIDKIKTNAVNFLNSRLVFALSPPDPNYVDRGFDNWHLTVSAMFLAEYRHKTGDTGVNADVQRTAAMLANRVRIAPAPNNGAMMHGGLDPANGYGGGGLNIINAQAMVAFGLLKGAGADFNASADTAGTTIQQKVDLNWNRLKTSTFMLAGNEQGMITYAGTPPTSAGRPGCPAGWDTNARTPASAVGYELYRRAGGTTATPDDLEKLSAMKAYTPRNWQRQHNCHAYTLGTVFGQMLLPFVSEREQRYFRENSRFLLTMSRDHAGTVEYFPGRANVGNDNTDFTRFHMPGFAWAIPSGNLPSFPAAAPASAYVRLKSHRSDWPQLTARRVKVVGLTQNLEAELTNSQGNVLSPAGYSFEWFQSSFSNPPVTFTSRNSLATPVTFPAAGTHRIGMSAFGGGSIFTEWFDFEVATSNPPIDTSAAITQHPVSRYALPGGSVTFPLTVSGAGPFVYQWKRNGVNFGDPQITPDLQLTNLSPVTAGAFQCSIVHPGGRLESREAVLSFPGTWKMESGGLKREVWLNIPGNTVAGLTGNPRYPECPDVTSSVTSGAGPRDYGDNYGQRLSGWIVAPLTGRYTFYVRCNDACELWISENESPAKLKKIAELSSTTGSVGGVDFTAGQRYYLEILHKAGTGGDFVEIVWQKPGDPPANSSTPAMPGSVLEYAAFTPDPLSDGLVSHWKFEETAGTTAVDSTAAANDGTIMGATPSAGRAGSGRLFDGTDQIQCGNAGALCGLQPFTVAAWIRVNNGNSTDGVIIQQRAANGVNGQYMLNVNGAGRLRFWCYGDDLTQFDFTGSANVNDGQWHHVAAARDGTGGAFLYVDGVLDASVSGTTVRNLDGKINIGIGADIRDNAHHFRGTIDDVRVYNRAFGAADAAALMNEAGAQSTRFVTSFTGLDDATTFTDGSVLSTNTPGFAFAGGGLLLMTAAETLFTRTQYVLPQLRPATYGFSARFRYGIVKPASGQWADGFSFYLKPAAEPVDIANNQVGGYAKGLGVEFITFSNPRHQIRVNNTVLPATYAVSPNVDSQWVNVRIDYTKPPGLPGRLTLYQNNVPVLSDIAVDYTPGISDVFAFTARTGAFTQSTLIDDIVVEPVNFLAMETVGVEHFGYANGGIAGQSSGKWWDFRNFLPEDHIGPPSAWQNVSGSPVIAGGKLLTASSSAKRSFNGSAEADGAVNDPFSVPSSREKKVYFRATVTTGAVLPVFFGLSSYDFGAERLFFGKRSNQSVFGLEALTTGTNSSFTVQPNTTYVLVGRVDFAGDNIAMWVNPLLNGEEPAPLVSQTYTGTNWSTAVRLASSGGSPVLWDDLVVATTWSDLGIMVTTTTDEDNGLLGGGAGISLREAVRHARPDALVTFAPALSGQTIQLSSALGQIVIPQAVTIDASGLPGGLTVDAQSTNRHFLITTGRFLTLRGLTLTRGLSPGGPGGAIFNDGTLRLEDCTLSQNTTGTGFAGGAVSSTGALSATRCSFVDNTAGSNGGGFDIVGGTAELSLCTIANNEAKNGSALWLEGSATTTLSQCTIAGNRSTGTTGNRRAIAVLNGTLTLLHCTVAQNSGTSAGGGLYMESPATVNLQHSIIAGNTDPAGGAPDIFYNGGSINAAGSNLIGINTSVEANFPAGTLAGTAATPLAPLLAPLADYGGPTQTMTLMPSSPARNAAVYSTITSDQRGFPIIGIPDLGACEAGNGLLTIYNAWIWETLPNTATAPQAATTFDYDGDGQSNGAEFDFLTDPGSGASSFSPTTTPSGSNLLISFPSATGRTYTLLYSDTLTGTFVSAGLPPIIGDDTEKTFTIPITSLTRRFYQVQAAP